MDASDDFLKSRVMNLPESVVAGTHNTEEGIKQLLLSKTSNLDSEQSQFFPPDSEEKKTFYKNCDSFRPLLAPNLSAFFFYI